MTVPVTRLSLKLPLFVLLLVLSCASCTTFLCTRAKGCVSETGLRAYCHQPPVSSFSLTVILQAPESLFTVYGFFDITQRFLLYRNGAFVVAPQPLRNVWCYVSFDVLGNEFDFQQASLTSVQEDDADFGPLQPFVANANESSIFVPVDESVISEFTNEIEGGQQKDKATPFGLCCGACRRR